MTEPVHVTEAHPPREIARMIERIGVAKARTDVLTLVILGVLAGAFISMGAMLYVVIVTDSTLGFGQTRLLGGMGFCLGLVLIVLAGAELFTGNNLLAMAWASGLIKWREVLRNWLLVYCGNVVGCMATVQVLLWTGIDKLCKGAVAQTAIDIARTKADLPFTEIFSRGILCNALVCLAVWLALSGRSVADKVLAVPFPVAAFVTLGLEHSIANWFFLPFGIWLDTGHAISTAGVVRNIVAATAGNIVGGTLLVAGVYWVAYLRPERRAAK